MNENTLNEVQLIKSLVKTANDKLGRILEKEPDGHLMVAREYLKMFIPEVIEAENWLKREVTHDKGYGPV